MATTTKIRILNTSTVKEAVRTDRVRIQKYISECWLPINQELLGEIRRKMQSGAYRESKALLEDIRQDAGIYSSFIRRISSTLGGISKRTLAGRDLLSALSRLPASEVFDYIPAVASRASRYKLASAEEFQVEQLRQLVITATTAQTLAAKIGVEPEVAFTSAFYRKLGYVLYSWNYPRFFSKLLAVADFDMAGIDARMGEMLGYPPSLLCYDLIKSSELGSEVLLALKSITPLDARGAMQLSEEKAALPNKERFDTLISCCEIGEAIAAGKASRFTGSINERWKWAEAKINKVLGSGGMNALEQSITAAWEPYAAALPVIYKSIFSASGERTEPFSEFSKQRYSSNQHIAKCSRLTQEAFLNVYKQIVEPKPSTEALRMLVSEIIPLTGFEAGCIFLANENRFVPTVYIGKAVRGEFKPLSSSMLGVVADPISKALRYGRPVKGVTLKERRETLYLAAPIGSATNRGVLYLEADYHEFDTEGDPLDYFKAILKCLADSLNLDPNNNSALSQEPLAEPDPLSPEVL